MWYMQTIGNIMSWRLWAFVFKLNYIFIMAVQTYLKHWADKMYSTQSMFTI